MEQISIKNNNTSAKKNNLRTYDNNPKKATAKGDHYTTSCILVYNYFNKPYKTIAIDLSKQLPLDARPKAIQQINFTGNLFWDGNANTTVFSIIEEAKGFYIFHKELWKYCEFTLLWYNISIKWLNIIL